MTMNSTMLFWARLTLQTHERSAFWWVDPCGAVPTSISSINFKYPQTIEYYAPIIQQSHSMGSPVVKLLFPSEQVFKYHQKPILSYYANNISYLWAWSHQITLCHPRSCVQCGWYCQQTCQTWNGTDSYLTSPKIFLNLLNLLNQPQTGPK